MTYADHRIAQIREQYGIDRLVERYGDGPCLQNAEYSLSRPTIYQVEFTADHLGYTRTVIHALAPGVTAYNLVDDFISPYAQTEILNLAKSKYFKPGSILTFSHSAKGYISDGTKIAPLPSVYSKQWLPVWRALEDAGVVVFTSSGNTSDAGVWQGSIKAAFNRLLGIYGPLPRNVFDVGPLVKNFSWWGWFRTKLVADHLVPCGWEGNADGIILTDNSSIPTALCAALFAIVQGCFIEETGHVPTIEEVNRGMENLKLYKIDGINIGRYFNCERLLEGMIDGPLKRRRL